MPEKTIFEKLQLKPGRSMVILNAPHGYIQSAGSLPSNAGISERSGPAFIIQVFIRSRDELESQFSSLASLVEKNGILWISYPKLTSKLKGDINRDTINQFAQNRGWTGVSIISIDEDWSALRLKPL